MKYDYLYKITFALNEPLDIKRINNVCRQYPNSPILVEIQNTKGITSSMIRQLNPNVAIRIAGSYDKDRLERYKGCSFKTESLEDYYYNSSDDHYKSHALKYVVEGNYKNIRTNGKNRVRN